MKIAKNIQIQKSTSKIVDKNNSKFLPVLKTWQNVKGSVGTSGFFGKPGGNFSRLGIHTILPNPKFMFIHQQLMTQ